MPEGGVEADAVPVHVTAAVPVKLYVMLVMASPTDIDCALVPLALVMLTLAGTGVAVLVAVAHGLFAGVMPSPSAMMVTTSPSL
jgi:ABC-type polysaccharide/polyol phosphate export permease